MSERQPAIFRPRARLMLLLGDELIKDAGIAVFELVKNAYDADATSCNVTLKNVHECGEDACVIVEDDGHGMDIQTVKKVWLSPGTRHRLTQREASSRKETRSAKYGRLPLGEKGVGRFAVHKLGDHIRMITRARHKNEVVVNINWPDFDSDEPLDSVEVSVRSRKPQIFLGRSTGTRIEITQLRDCPWTRRRVRALHRSVTSICSPIEHPESFQATLRINPDPGKWLAGMMTAKEAMKHALFSISGRIENGFLTYDYRFKPPRNMDRVEGRKEPKKRIEFPAVTSRDDMPPEEDERIIDLVSHKIGPIDFDFSIFDRDRQTLKLLPGDSKTLTDFLDVNGGVRVYREGVRVYDFGEQGNDWLELGGRRVNVPAKRIGNNQIVGVVRIQLEASRDLEEKTNREGFVENLAYVMFKRAVRFALKQAESERNKDKDRIRRAYVNPKQKQPVLGELQDLREEIKKLRIARPAEQRLSKYLDQIDIQYREVLDRFLTAAGAGLNLALVLHEVDKNITTLHEAISIGENRELILERAKQLAELVDSLTWLTRQSGKKVQPASDFIRQCMFAWNFRFKRHKITVENGIDLGDPDFDVRCNRRLISTALMNLVDNSIYWLGTKTRNKKLYLGTSYELNGKPGLIVADNGPGFQDPPEYMVSAFYTRKPDGMGLGLHLADEIMRTQSGRVLFPLQNEITLPDEYVGAITLLEFDKKS